MSEDFHLKLQVAIKVLSMSRGGLAAELGVHKSVVSRWARGSAPPSAHNLARLSDLVATRIEGFTTLDWDRAIESFALRLGADLQASSRFVDHPASESLSLTLLAQGRATASRRGTAYEGIYRTTRLVADMPGRFIHDTVMMRLHANGQLRFIMRTNSVRVEGWATLLHNQLFVVAEELTTDSFAYAIINGVNQIRATVLDGLILRCALDAMHTPTASGVVAERIADLSDDPAADEARFEALAKGEAVAEERTIPDAMVTHLTRDVSAVADGAGAGLMTLPPSRSFSRGVTWTGERLGTGEKLGPIEKLAANDTA